MTQIVFPRQVLEKAELTTVSTTAAHNIGEIVTLASSSTGQVSKYKYVGASGAALTAYQPYVLTQTNTIIKGVAPATSTVSKYVGIPQATIADGSYGFVCIEGPCSASIYTAAVGDFLEAINAGTYMIVDGSTGSTVETANSIAVCAAVNAVSAAATKAVVLLGKPVAVAAS
jgi:hypothetical protein